jgi:hypothetical protein
MAKPHQPTLETLHTLTKIRRDFYGLLSSAYIQIPERKIFELKWEPAVELLEYLQEGSEIFEGDPERPESVQALWFEERSDR